jgi:hypothetical protein
MTDPKIDGWYQATNSGARVVFGFRVEDGEVVECAPYGRKMIMGLQWGTAYGVLERGAFEVARLDSPPAPAPDDPERAMRFGHLLSEIEIGARRMLDGDFTDGMAALALLALWLREATEIYAEVSREALDKAARP